MNISKTGIALIKKYEGCSLKAYYCPAKVLTIGWGHTGKDVKNGDVITQQKADSMLVNDLSRYEANVNKFNSKFKWSQNEYDALVSFAYNLGSIDGLVRGCNTKEQISVNIPKYCYAGGKKLKGLERRRADEQKLFNTKVLTK